MKTKKRITEADYLQANRKASREEELALHGRPVRRGGVHKSKKAYDRNKQKADTRRLPFDFPFGRKNGREGFVFLK